jgi:hypothetical protein
VAAVTKSSDGSNLQKPQGSDAASENKRAQELDQNQALGDVVAIFARSCEGHHTEVLVAPGAHCNGTRFAFSLSPTTRMYGSFCNECSRILYVIFSLRKSSAP